MWWLLAGLAFAAPYYEAREFSIDIAWPDERDLCHALLDQIQPWGIRTWVRVDGQRRPVKPCGQRLSLDAVAAGLVATLYTTEGAEIDLLVGLNGRAARPVTVWWDERRLVFAEGTPGSLRVPEGPPPEVLRARYGLAELREEGRAWDARATGFLDEALGRLSEAERARVADVAWVRTPGQAKNLSNRAPTPEGFLRPAAAYVDDEEGARIEVYDAAFDDVPRFVGDPSDPYPKALQVLLHEIGHALARSVRREARALHAGLRSQRKEVAARYQALVASRETADEDRRPALDADIEVARAEAEALALETARVAALTSAGVSPPAAALERFMGSLPAPTAYGRTSREEGFAESFSLFHADRAALVRAAPEAVIFFDDGRHLEVLDLARASLHGSAPE